MWLGLHASTSDSMSSMTAKETKILHAKGPKKTLQNPWFPPPFFFHYPIANYHHLSPELLQKFPNSSACFQAQPHSCNP